MDQQPSLFSDLPSDQSLAQAPLPGFTDLAFDARRLLRLRIGHEQFISQQIIAWVLVE